MALLFGAGRRTAAVLEAPRSRRVAAVALGEKARHAADGGNADAGQAVDLAVGQATLEAFDNRPAVGHGLHLGRGAQIAQEGAALLGGLEQRKRGAQGALGERLLARSDVLVDLHSSSIVITR